MKVFTFLSKISLVLLPLGSLAFSKSNDNTANITNKDKVVQEVSCTTNHWIPGTKIEWIKPTDTDLKKYKAGDSCKINIQVTTSASGAVQTSYDYTTKSGQLKTRLKKSIKLAKDVKDKATESIKNALVADSSLSEIGSLLSVLGDSNTQLLSELVKKDPTLLKEVSSPGMSKSQILSKLQDKGLDLNEISQAIQNDASGSYAEWQDAIDMNLYGSPSRLFQYQSVADILAIRPDNFNETQKSVYSITAGVCFSLFLSMVYGLNKVSGMSSLTLGRKKQYFLFLLGLGLLVSSGMGGYMLYNLLGF